MTDRAQSDEHNDHGHHRPDGPSDDRTGNETVNREQDADRDGGAASGAAGPDEVLGGGALAGGGARGGDALADDDAPGADDPDADHLGVDELALRRLLHGAVSDLAPSEGALDHLRRAVPARRARKRQALVGAAAAVILLGTGVPAFVHVAGSGGTSDANPVNAGHGEQVQGGTGDHTSGTAGEQAAGNPSGELGVAGKDGKDTKPKPPRTASGTSDGAADGTADPATSVPATLPVCEADQLGVISADAGAPGPNGKVYGTFRIANVSSADCVVDGAGTVGFRTTGAADPARISVVPHTSGDAASGLPDPSASVAGLALKPSAAYEVKFAWVPSETCPVKDGPTPEPSTSPTEGSQTSTGGSATGSTDGGTDTTTQTEPQLATSEGTSEGSVQVTHTPQPGAPHTETTVPDACTGTIYHTGLLPAE
ncbi:hypothetical protein [Streptomyces sp. TRM49041]|uniref:hypothetical protein n=1 Tax=Streptomyces sp. TRM49041 TaxID=2603216 RepID=UPI0021CCBBE3|nr:hypothetical protein [Streptomyces sp. TRM49041]